MVNQRDGQAEGCHTSRPSAVDPEGLTLSDTRLPWARPPTLTSATAAAWREQPTTAGLRDPALRGAEGDAVDLRHRC